MALPITANDVGGLEMACAAGVGQVRRRSHLLIVPRSRLSHTLHTPNGDYPFFFTSS